MNGPKGCQMLRSTTTTFIDVLNDNYAKSHVLSLIKSTTEVFTNTIFFSIWCINDIIFKTLLF